MFFSPKIQEALNFASQAHAGQKRKVNKDPYIIHPLSVALILARLAVSEEVIMAALLHDTVEDCGAKIETIQKQFGEKVASMVKNVTEPDKSLSWEERKRASQEKVKSLDHDSILLEAADVLYNLSDLINWLEERGEKIFVYFHAGKEKQLDKFQKLYQAFEQAWPENPLLPEIKIKIQKFREF